MTDPVGVAAPLRWPSVLGVAGGSLLASAGAVAFWRTSGATPGGGELLLGLLVGPAALSLAAVLARSWWTGRRERSVQGVAADETWPRSDADAGDPLSPEPVLQVQASAVWLPAGRDAAEVIDALRMSRRPRLHATLRDLHGFPATVAEAEGVEPIDPVDHEAHAEGDGARTRALALLFPVAEELLREALAQSASADAGPAHEEALPAMHPYAMHHSQSARAPAARRQARLRVALLVSCEWPEPARARAMAWLRTLAESLGHHPDGLALQCVPVHHEADLWDWWAQQARELHDSPVAEDRWLVLATDSRVSESHVERLHGEGRLLRTGAPEGEVPGEGAAGLLIAAPPRLPCAACVDGNEGPSAGEATAGIGVTDAPRVHLYAPQRAQVDAGERAREAARTSGTLIARALALAGCDGPSSLQVITNADHRPSRMTEAATALVAQRPELDPVDDALHLCVACGSLGVAAPVALLALAAAQARATATATLACSLADATARAVTVLVPVTDHPRLAADNGSAA